MQTAGWRITEDERGPLLEAPRGLARLGSTVAAVSRGRSAPNANRTGDAAIVRAWLEIAATMPSINAVRRPLRRCHAVPDENLLRAAAGPPFHGSVPHLDRAAICRHYLHLEFSKSHGDD